ncbi:MAG: transposase [Planctomycetota bacterium]|nr:transposase [Planctomycetota bacterium]
MAKGKVRDKSKEAFWRRAVRRQGQSDLTVRAFCREHALRETAFYFWRRELARREVADAAFVPVRVVEEAPTPAGGRIEIVLSGDRRVHVAAPVDRRALADVLAVLEASAC